VVATCSYIVSILIAQQYIDQPASRPGWQSGLGAIYPVLGVATLVLLGVVSLRRTVAQPGADRTQAKPPDSGLPAAS
jgi:alpha-1,2-mannosyltransferase